MAAQFLIDTDVMIDYLRGRAEAVAYIEGLPHRPILSVITVAELYGGVRDGDERVKLDAAVAIAEVLPVDVAIAVHGGLYRRDYGKSHGVGLADALIAATSEAGGLTLATLNRKHFPMLATVVVPYTKP